MALQITGTIKIGKAKFDDLYIKVDFHGENGIISIDAKGYESLTDFNAGQPPVATHGYTNVAPSNFGALAGNVALAFQTRAEAYVKADILARFPSVSVANV